VSIEDRLHEVILEALGVVQIPGWQEAVHKADIKVREDEFRPAAQAVRTLQTYWVQGKDRFLTAYQRLTSGW
jgi:hypothetical protein